MDAIGSQMQKNCTVIHTYIQGSQNRVPERRIAQFCTSACPLRFRVSAELLLGRSGWNRRANS